MVKNNSRAIANIESASGTCYVTAGNSQMLECGIIVYHTKYSLTGQSGSVNNRAPVRHANNLYIPVYIKISTCVTGPCNRKRVNAGPKLDHISRISSVGSDNGFAKRNNTVSAGVRNQCIH